MVRAARDAMVTLTTERGLAIDDLGLQIDDAWMNWLDDVHHTEPLLDKLTTVMGEHDTPPRHVQRCLSGDLASVDLERFRAMLRSVPDSTQQELDVLMARHLSLSGIGATAFAACLPSLDAAFTMQPHLYREACRGALGIERPHTPDSRCYSCSSVNTAAHCRRCTLTGQLTVRHHQLCRSIVSGLQLMGLTGVRAEDSVPFVAGDDPKKRIDITIPGGQGFAVTRGPHTDMAAAAAESVIIDVSLVESTGAATLSHARTEPTYAAEQRARDKHAHYDTHFAHSRYTLVPFAFEIYGSACKEVHTFINNIASFKAEKSCGTWRKGSIVDWWRRRLSIALQSAVAQALDTNMGRSRPNTGAALYTQVRLLRRVAPLHAIATAHANTQPQGM